eukprot:COSAG02_NODE_5711_length_4103_cov_8.928367_1_plen_444_part_10
MAADLSAPLEQRSDAMEPRLGADGTDGTVGTRPKRQQATSWSARGSPRRYRPQPPFRSAQLRQLKSQHAAHCQTLPGGRPLVLIVEPKWWKQRRQQRRRTKGTKAGAKGRNQPTTAERLFGRIRSQLSIVRREDTLLQTYAARIARDASRNGGHTAEPSEVGRSRNTRRAAKRKIQSTLSEMEERVEQQWREQPGGAVPLFRRAHVLAGKQRNAQTGWVGMAIFDSAETADDGWRDGTTDPGLVWRALWELNNYFGTRWLGSAHVFPELLHPELEPEGSSPRSIPCNVNESRDDGGGMRFDDVEWPSSDSDSEFEGESQQQLEANGGVGSRSPGSTPSDDDESSEDTETDSYASDSDECPDTDESIGGRSDGDTTDGMDATVGEELSPSDDGCSRKRRRRGQRIDYALLNSMMFGGADGDALAGEASEDDDWAGSPKRRGRGRG